MHKHTYSSLASRILSCSSVEQAHQIFSDAVKAGKLRYWGADKQPKKTPIVQAMDKRYKGDILAQGDEFDIFLTLAPLASNKVIAYAQIDVNAKRVYAGLGSYHNVCGKKASRENLAHLYSIL